MMGLKRKWALQFHALPIKFGAGKANVTRLLQKTIQKTISGSTFVPFSGQFRTEGRFHFWNHFGFPPWMARIGPYITFSNRTRNPEPNRVGPVFGSKNGTILKTKSGFFSKHKRTHFRKTGTDFAVFSHTAGHQQVCIASFLNRSACKLHKLISLLCKTCF